jgi:hypothetical protein
MGTKPLNYLGLTFAADREDRVTGYVLDFAFGPAPQSYFATFYPYRFEFATRHDLESRVIKKQVTETLPGKCIRGQGMNLTNSSLLC